jgi:hypothetical protein
MKFGLPEGKNERRLFYEELLTRGIFDARRDQRHAELQLEFGPPEKFRASMQVVEETPVETATPVAEENQYIDWAMDDPLEDELIEPLDKRLRPSEKRIMATKPDAKNLSLASDFPTPKEMQAAAPNRLDNRSDFRKFVDDLSMPDKEEPKTETLIAAEEAKEKVELENVKPAVETMEDVVETEEVVEESGAVPVDMKQTEGYLEGKNIVSVSDPYGYGLETYDGVIDKLMDLEDIYGGDEYTEGSFEFFETEKQNYVNLANDIKKEIDTYEDSINAIAEEKPGPAITGANKFWAVIAAALGAGAASLTGTPNFALQIINKTIDDHLTKFKNDRDFRQKSAERQQLNLIQERGRMLQLAQNASDSALASLKNRAAVESQIATVEGIKSGIVEARERSDQQMAIALQTLLVKQYQAVADSKKEFGDKYVPGLGVTSIKDSQGIKDALKDGRKMMTAVRSIEELRERALNLFNKVGTANLLAQSAAGIKKAQGKDYIELRQLVGSLWGVYKNDIMKGGAALTPTEKVMINRVIPEEDVFTIGLGELKSALETLPNDYESRLKGFQDANQFVPVTPVDYGFVQEGMPPKGMPRRNKIPNASDFGGTVRNAGG